MTCERSQNTVLLTSTQAAIYKAPHSTVRGYSSHSSSSSWCICQTSASESGSASRVAHSFCSNKLYICLSNKCFKVYPVDSLCTDVRPSQDHRILRMQTVRINLALGRADIAQLVEHLPGLILMRQRQHDRCRFRAPPIPARSNMEEISLAAILATQSSAGVTLEVNLS